ncbi:hypothetical protein MUN82_05980 [Hymenobacter aerilatus]|uniref:Uncharacterized protein n=1 Tax=Hymenobacter aerilatus TaxID=2932251 RepID=A0A8T9SXQ8_9BACT|nr:hypothetical protein [Hymenobacter aerilatus]UOR06645.1 hypothetical protein MUN82_05980 [Hymenobacter aerilatus]
MTISIERIIKEADISPLYWGMNEDAITQILPNSFQLIQEHRLENRPLLDVDNIEFYFENDFYIGLNQLIIQAWRIKPNTSTQYFDLSWIDNKLTYRKVKQNLARLEWVYIECPNGSNAPLILVEGRAMFLFYDDESEISSYPLCKIVILQPKDAQAVLDRITQ